MRRREVSPDAWRMHETVVRSYLMPGGCVSGEVPAPGGYMRPSCPNYMMPGGYMRNVVSVSPDAWRLHRGRRVRST